MQSGADLVMLPELAVSGYPPEDLLFHSGMRTQVARSHRAAARPRCAESP